MSAANFSLEHKYKGTRRGDDHQVILLPSSALTSLLCIKAAACVWIQANSCDYKSLLHELNRSVYIWSSSETLRPLKTRPNHINDHDINWSLDETVHVVGKKQVHGDYRDLSDYFLLKRFGYVVNKASEVQMDQKSTQTITYMML